MLSLDKAYGFHIVRIARLLRLHFSRFAEKNGFDISQEQWLIMNKLAHNPGQSQLELGDALIHDKPNITRILAGMEKRKLIQRRVDTSDRRIMRVSLSAQGRKLHEEFSEVVANERPKIYAGLAEADFINLMKVLSQLETNISRNM